MGFVRVGSQSFTGIFTCLAARSETCYCSAIARPLLAYATDADPDTLINMSEAMKQAFGLVRRPWGVFYLKHKITGEQKSLKTNDKIEAQRILQAHNEAKCQPHFNLSLARVYLNGADPKLATRTWQEVMENIVTKKTDETRRRWEVAIKDRNFDYIRNLRVAETRPEHFDRALADGKVSTNVYLRRIHNHALGMEWLLKSVIPRLQWPKPVFKDKRAITAEEHTAIVQREQNKERRDFYELLWYTGASQTDAACLMAEDVDWNSRTISYPALRRFAKRALCSCVDQPYEDTKVFLLSYASAFAQKPCGQRASNMGNSAFEIHCFMLIHWQFVERLNSVHDLHQVLVKVFGPYRTGDLKRTEKSASGLIFTTASRGVPLRSKQFRHLPSLTVGIIPVSTVR